MSGRALSTHVAQNYIRQTAAIADLLEDFESRGETLHRKRNTVKQMQLEDTAVVVKSFKVLRGIRAFVYGRIRKSKARRSYEHAQRLRTLGLETPEPIAFAEQHRRGQLGASYYICEYYPHDFSMAHALSIREDGSRPDDSDAIIEAFTRFTFDLHEAGVLHRDHNAGNTLVRRKAEGWTFAIIDINRMRFGPLNLQQRMNNLVRLTDDVATMQLLARTYAGLAKESPERCEALLMREKQRHWRKLARKTRAKKLLGRRGR